MCYFSHMMQHFGRGSIPWWDVVMNILDKCDVGQLSYIPVPKWFMQWWWLYFKPKVLPKSFKLCNGGVRYWTVVTPCGVKICKLVFFEIIAIKWLHHACNGAQWEFIWHGDSISKIGFSPHWPFFRWNESVTSSTTWFASSWYFIRNTHLIYFWH